MKHSHDCGSQVRLHWSHLNSLVGSTLIGIKLFNSVTLLVSDSLLKFYYSLNIACAEVAGRINAGKENALSISY
jgi:hypothetical protein